MNTHAHTAASAPTPLEQSITAILSDLTAIPAERIQATDRLRGDLGMDSVASMELLGMLDEEFGVEVDLEDTLGVDTVAEVFALAQRYIDA